MPFWQIFVEALEEFTILIIKSKISTSTHEYTDSNRANENRGLSPVLEAEYRHQLVLVSPTVLFW